MNRSVSWAVWFLFWQHLYNSVQDVEGGVFLKSVRHSLVAKNDPTIDKTQLQPHKSHKGQHKSIKTSDKGDCTTESQRSPTTEDHTTKTRSQNT